MHRVFRSTGAALQRFTAETAHAKVKKAQALWNTQDPEKIAPAYTEQASPLKGPLQVGGQPGSSGTSSSSYIPLFRISDLAPIWSDLGPDQVPGRWQSASQHLPNTPLRSVGKASGRAITWIKNWTRRQDSTSHGRTALSGGGTHGEDGFILRNGWRRTHSPDTRTADGPGTEHGQDLQAFKSSWRAYHRTLRYGNRDQFFSGHEAIKRFLTNKWKKEKRYTLKKELFGFGKNKIAV
ncbi:hypothetical protein V8E36_006848 [Tilletia maclaganii]